MKTLTEKIIELATNQNGTQSKRYAEVLDFVSSQETKVYVGGYSGSGRWTKATYNAYYSLFLDIIGIDYKHGNDAPRGGASGDFIELTAKGKRQLAKFRKLPLEIRNPWKYQELKARDERKQRIETKQKEVFEKYGNQTELLTNYFISKPDFLSTIKDRIENYSSKQWRGWVKMKVVQKLFDESFENCNLSAADIRDTAYSI